MAMKLLLPIFGIALIALLAWKTPQPETGRAAAPAISPEATIQQTPGTGLSASIARGKTLYEQQCLSCHMVDGSGVPTMNPPLIKTSFVLGPKATLIKVVIAGMTGVDVDDNTYHNNMPAHPELTDQQVADVLTYIRHNFGNKATQVTVADVKAARARK
jgi:mono/diheme cytochrome c family protein